MTACGTEAVISVPSGRRSTVLDGSGPSMPEPLVSQWNPHWHASRYGEVLATNSQLGALAFDDCEGNLAARHVHL